MGCLNVLEGVEFISVLLIGIVLNLGLGTIFGWVIVY